MSTQPFEPKLMPPANLVQIGSTVEDTIQQRLAEERARLEREAGLVKREVHQFKKPVEKPFTAEQRPNTTLLFGGLTWKHEKLVHGALGSRERLLHGLLEMMGLALDEPRFSFQAGALFGEALLDRVLYRRADLDEVRRRH